MQAYARRNLALADAYVTSLSDGPARDFSVIPLALAYATLDALCEGKDKLSRSEVHRMVDQTIRQTHPAPSGPAGLKPVPSGTD